MLTAPAGRRRNSAADQFAESGRGAEAWSEPTPPIVSTPRGDTDDHDRRPALHRLRRPHPRAPDRDARVRAGRVPRPRVAHRDRRGRRRVPPLQRLRHAVERPVARRHRRASPTRRSTGPAAATCATPRCGRRRTTPRRASQDMDTDGIDLAVLYPTSMLGLQSVADEEFARVQARAYNDWASDHTQEGEGRLFAAGAVPPMNDEDGVQAVADEIRRVAEKPGMVSRVPAPEPVGRLAAVQRQGLRPGVAGRGRDRSGARVPPVPHARPPGRVPRPEAGAAVRRRELRAVGRGARRTAGRWATSSSPRRSPTRST